MSYCKKNELDNNDNIPNSAATKNVKNDISAPQIKNKKRQKNNNGNGTAIQKACKNKSLKSLQVLIDKGFDVNSLNNDGETALHVACKNNWKEGVEFLIGKGADSSIHSKEGKLAKDLTNEDEILGILESE